jgi:hypothetical protein
MSWFFDERHATKDSFRSALNHTAGIPPLVRAAVLAAVDEVPAPGRAQHIHVIVAGNTGVGYGRVRIEVEVHPVAPSA